MAHQTVKNKNDVKVVFSFTVDDHGAGGDGLLFDGGDFAAINATQLVSGLEDFECPVPLVRIVGGPVVEIEPALEHAEILRPFPRNPLVDGTGTVLEVPLDHQLRFLVG